MLGDKTLAMILVKRGIGGTTEQVLQRTADPRHGC